MQIRKFILHFISIKAKNLSLCIPHSKNISYTIARSKILSSDRILFGKIKAKKRMFINLKANSFKIIPELQLGNGTRYKIICNFLGILIIKQLN